ncbi:MAG TPA: MarR family transcriptional regulator, partial [Polyangiaceae bacterium]
AIAQHPAGVSRLLDELEKRGDVLRSRDPRDRRKVHVAVTPRGRRRFDTALPEVAQAVEQAFEPLSESERRLLRDLLRKVAWQDADCRTETKSGR